MSYFLGFRNVFHRDQAGHLEWTSLALRKWQNEASTQLATALLKYSTSIIGQYNFSAVHMAGEYQHWVTITVCIVTTITGVWEHLFCAVPTISFWGMDLHTSWAGNFNLFLVCICYGPFCNGWPVLKRAGLFQSRLARFKVGRQFICAIYASGICAI